MTVSIAHRCVVLALVALVAGCADTDSSDEASSSGGDPIGGEPLLGDLQAVFESEPAQLAYGVAFALQQTNVYGGRMEIWMSESPIDCSFDTGEPVGAGVYALLSPDEAAVGVYDPAFVQLISVRRDGFKSRGSQGAIEIAELAGGRVAGSVVWDHDDDGTITMDGTFDVVVCP